MSVFQEVSNWLSGSYKVKVIRLSDSSLVQSVNAILPLISNQDDDGAGTVYTGYALRGTADSNAAWFIMKSVTSGTITTVRFASLPFVMDQVWNNRASLSYS
jgi:hypothetical protein